MQLTAESGVGGGYTRAGTGASRDQLDIACLVSKLASAKWGDRSPTSIIGVHASLDAALEKVARFAASDSPVLITGETGTGKELFARALYLMSDRRDRPFLSVNCAQYHDGQLIASELFGHRRGAFTGAVADHKGLFEEGDGGVIFLDEVGELTLPAQAMLLRALGEGEIMPVGSTRAKHVNVRVVAATSRDLKPMVESGRFRPDLYYRLRYLHVVVPPVRDRGDDWELIAEHYLRRLCARGPSRKSFSAEARRTLREYHWPGNVREVRSIVDAGFHLSRAESIESRDFAEHLEQAARCSQLGRVPTVGRVADLVARMTGGRESFWDVVHAPFMTRDLSRAEAREIVLQGLTATRGSYKRLVALFGMAEDDYLKFMDFLRHQKLKPGADDGMTTTGEHRAFEG